MGKASWSIPLGKMKLSIQPTPANIVGASGGGSASTWTPVANPSTRSCVLAAAGALRGMRGAKQLSAPASKFKSFIQCSYRMSVKCVEPKEQKTITGRQLTCSEAKRSVGQGHSCAPRATNAGTISLPQTPTVLARHNMALNLAPFGRWTLRDKAAQRRLALR
jgi:hypothetical protein